MLNGAGTELSDRESAELRWACKHLEHPSLAARLSSRLASPIEEGLALLAELPLTTVLMLRSIAGIARSEGEDLNQKDARLACVQVFALGGRTREDEDADTEQGTPCSIV